MYKARRNSWVDHVDFVMLDLAGLLMAYVLSYFLRNGLKNVAWDVSFRQGIILMTLIHFCVGFFSESYRGILRRGLLQEWKAVCKQVTLTMTSLIVLFFILRSADAYSRMVILAAWAEGIVLLTVLRTVWKLYLQKRLQKGSHVRNLLLVTEQYRVLTTMEVLEKHSYGVYHIIGVCMLDNDIPGGTIYGTPVVMKGREMEEFTRDCVVDEVLLDLQDERQIQEETERFLEMGITVHQCLARVGRENHHTKTVENLGGFTVLSSSIRIASPRQMFLKRAMDIAGGLVGVFLTGILTVIIGPIIYLKSPGPIFFYQERIGKNGRRFRIYKFRSMYPDAEERKKELMARNNIKGGMMFKMDDDPRIIKGIGQFIRKTSIDEFPQFWNVLKGDMSLVGTRPPTVDEWEKYELHHRRRLATRPGLTGMWQVSGRSSITDFEKVVSLDTQYITEWSLGLDIRILFKTVEVILRGEGAV
ncbi:MAG: sugar transferase [Candidatus Limivivens sp.]|nr:sugar transferase [Candidatus Limivivens sp.]